MIRLEYYRANLELVWSFSAPVGRSLIEITPPDQLRIRSKVHRGNLCPERVTHNSPGQGVLAAALGKRYQKNNSRPERARVMPTKYRSSNSILCFFNNEINSS